MVIAMTERRRNTDTRAATAASSQAAARRRAERAAREMLLTPTAAWSLEAFSEIATLGSQALAVIKRETSGS